MVPDSSLLARAAACYLDAELPQDAARCYRAAGAYRTAAELWETLEVFGEAARDYAAAGAHEQAAWVFVHHLGDVPAARAELAAARTADATNAREDPAAEQGRPQDIGPRAAELRQRLIAARCDVAEDVARAGTLAVLGEVMTHLEHEAPSLLESGIEQLAVAVAESMNRPDLVALLFAAAVRGGRTRAAGRWDEWSRRVLGVPLILPHPDTESVLETEAAARPAPNPPVPDR
jgi:hypothetical protein